MSYVLHYERGLWHLGWDNQNTGGITSRDLGVHRSRDGGGELGVLDERFAGNLSCTCVATSVTAAGWR